jgi:hypothetical protein
MPDIHTRGEMHGCIVCGRLHELYVIYDADGKLVDWKVMSSSGVKVPNSRHPLVACDHHTGAEVERAVERVFGDPEFTED